VATKVQQNMHLKHKNAKTGSSK